MNLLDYDSVVPDDLYLDSSVKKYLTSFLRDGFVVIPSNSDFLDKVEHARHSFFEFKKNNEAITTPIQDSSGCLRRIVNLHTNKPAIAELFTSNPSLPFLDYIMGEATLYTSLVFEKGSTQDIHRDTPYFWTNPQYSYVGVWVALEDVGPGNGALRVVPGGHKLPELDRQSIAKKFFKDLDSINPYSDELWCEYQALVKQQYVSAGLIEKEIHVSKGDTIIWHPQLPHGGSPILDDLQTRLSIAMHVTPPHLAVYHQDVFFSNKVVPSTKDIKYSEINNRRYIAHDTVSFGHVTNYTHDQLL